MTPEGDTGRWSDALTAIRLLAHACALGTNSLGGIRLRAAAGPVRDRWLDLLRDAAPRHAPVVRLTPAVAPGRLSGDIDLAASLVAGRPVSETGLLARADRGFAVLAMAERCPPAMAAALALSMDAGEVAPARSAWCAPARFLLVALDEGEGPDETLPALLADRLALTIDLTGVSIREAQAVPVAGEWRLEPGTCMELPAVPDDLMEIMCSLSAVSLRPALSLVRVARQLAAVDGEPCVAGTHVATALRLVLGLTLSPPQEPAAQGQADETPDPTPPDQDTIDDQGDAEGIDPSRLRDMVVEAAKAARLDLPSAIANRGARNAQGAAGRSGAERSRARRGRPVGVAATAPHPGARPDPVATLYAAIPWQRLRSGQLHPGTVAGHGARIAVRMSDFRWRRLRHPSESAAIFAVDASGSTALERLSEAKGAIELILADCYARRDHVALIAFRGGEAEILLEPTRSLVRAKKSLGALPGGGTTPLADGLQKSLQMAMRVRQRGQSPLVVLMTDGSGNVALDGVANRQRAREDSDRLARLFAAGEIPSVVVDIARRPRDTARELAGRMNADYRQLPRADATALSGLVTGYLRP